MVASHPSYLPSNHSVETENSFAPFALRSACLFGANASGKSSFVGAIEFFGSFIYNSATKYTQDEEIPFFPFKLEEKNRGEPSSFEAIFIHDQCLYQYGFSVNKKRVTDEWLFMRPNTPGSRMRHLVKREYDQDHGEYVWHLNESYLKGEREAWKQSTRENALFLSTAVQLNSEALKPIHDWVSQKLRVITSPDRLLNNYTSKALSEPKRKTAIYSLLNSMDIPFDEIVLSEADDEIPASLKEIFRASALEKILEQHKNEKSYSVEILRKSASGKMVAFDLGEESDGTQVLYGLSGPIVDVIENGRCLVVDELHNSLHPIALRTLLRIFNDPIQNPNKAQLIFTSHETSIMDHGALNRDQIWLTEKDAMGKTSVSPLSDFKVRKEASFQRMYLAGKFGGVPRTRNEIF
tara:strand:+ start:668 stop:1891 length:1224 start_codon:yes stop_codon:yes gene_type:complete